MSYDSKKDTELHISRIHELIDTFIKTLQIRAEDHDRSKLQDPEKAIFDKFTLKLKNTTYGSDEYKEYLSKMKPALKHHYASNRHHPEHFLAGINGMNLIDLLEMLCDWKAAGERHADGNMKHSLEINKKRFEIQDQLQTILENTVHDLLD